MAKKANRLPSAISRRLSPGAPPGTLLADPNALAPVISLTAYRQNELLHIPELKVAELIPYLAKWSVVWVNVIGLGDIDQLQQLGQLFGLHPLALEDVVNTHQRCKVDDYETHHYIVSKQVSYQNGLKTQQVSFFLGKGYVLSFLEYPSESCQIIHSRLQNEQSQLRHEGADYLVYELLDASVDSYFPVLQAYGEALDEVEDETVLKPSRTIIARIHELKRDIITLKRDMWSQREMLVTLQRNSIHLFKPKTTLYLRDCYDHTIQIIELLEVYRDRSSSLTDIYLSSMANRLNEIMKVLTIISTIFMPLGFLAGLWGMNFTHMPELHWHYGYLMALAIMISTVVLLLGYFWRKGWLTADLPKQR